VKTATETVNLIRSGALSAVDAVQEGLDRIAALEPALHAWSSLDAEAALEAARRADAVPVAQRPLLAGLPVGIKDIFDVAGMKTGLGAQFAAYSPQQDAESVRRLREAGAIVLGKTETTQFAHADPAPTTNPWNTAHTPGGSSSGSAAAVAAGMVPAAIGSQTVGSVLRPAAYCGIVGLKPTHGRVSAAGVFPLASPFDHVGVFGRNVEDAALLLNVIAGFDHGDLFAQDVPAEDYLAAARDPRPPVILLPRRFTATAADAEITAHVEATAQSLAAAGAEVREVDIPAEPDDLLAHGRIIQAAETAAAHAMLFQTFREAYRPRLRTLIDQGLDIAATEYIQASSQLRYIRRALIDILKDGDVLLMASAPSTAPLGLESTGNAILCAPASFSGLPSISLPSGIGAGGLPLAVQLVASHWQEATLLRSAAWVERQLAFHGTPAI